MYRAGTPRIRFRRALKAARSEIEELEANEETNWPLISYALRQKANRAKYDAKRRRK